MTTKSRNHKLTGYALKAFGVSQLLLGARNLINFYGGLRQFDLSVYSGADKGLVLGLLGADGISNLALVAFGLVAITLGYNLVRGK